MSYLVLARKFRPSSFSAILGQEHISVALSNAIKRDKVPHALLFSGPRGVGKTTAARVFAKALNCRTRLETDSEPCLECQSCKEISASSNLAVWEIDGASNNSVENIRSLIESLQTAPPPGAKFKVYIIDEVHMLSNAAFNALLKSLEEPPPNTVFIFATTEQHKIPETVVSRCQVYDFRRLPDEVIHSQLKCIAEAEKVEVDEEVLSLIVSRSRGGMRDAQSMLDRLFAFALDKIDIEIANSAFGVAGEDFFFKLSENIFSQSTSGVLQLCDEVFSRGLDIRSFFDDFVSHWRSLMLVSVSASSSGKQDKRFGDLFALVEGKEGFDILRLFEQSETIATKALGSAYPREVFEAGVCKMASMPSLRPLAEFITQGQKKNFSSKSLDSKILSEKSTKPSPEKPLAQKETTSYNPRWEEFVKFVKERKKLVLEAYLRRVSVSKFSDGQLSIEATSFDASYLDEKANKDSLSSCLYAYSGNSQWQINISESESVDSSIAIKQGLEKKKTRNEREQQARESSLVKTALETFEGSSVEKVILLKR